MLMQPAERSPIRRIFPNIFFIAPGMGLVLAFHPTGLKVIFWPYAKTTTQYSSQE